ncbi:MAG: GGDEF domain-containing protein [Firmicutes bacterium]|nr:GGDEF domain-containing protein [Bacillota bacterium]
MQGQMKTTDLKQYLFVVLLSVVILFVAGYQIITAAQNFYNGQVAEETQRLANIYAQKLAAAAEATTIIDGLLEDKLLATGQIVALYDGQYSNRLLAEIADIMQVDEIYVYNREGQIVYSNTGIYLGWHAKEGHPVYNFMRSGKQSHVDEIRRDSESERYLKYAYWRLNDTGRFLQMGVLAERVRDFLGRFELQCLLTEIVADPYIKCAVFYDNNLEPIAHQGHEGDFILTADAKAAMQEGREFAGEIYSGDAPFYQVLLPVWVEDRKLGTLAVHNELGETKLLIARVRMIGITTLVIVFGLLLAMLSSNRKKNETLIRYSYYDAVTGLPNKTYWEEFFQSQANSNGHKKRACLLIDCNFDLLNMAIGYQYSEMILKECAATLLLAKTSAQHIFHLGAARFMLYVTSYGDRSDLIAMAQQVIDSLRQPLQAKRTGVAIGIVEIDGEREVDANTIIKRASIAASCAGEQDSEGYCFFDNSMEEQLLRQTIVEGELRAAVSSQMKQNVHLVYQPIVDLKQNQIVGLEALARMHSVHLGNVSPAEFIPVAEQTGLIIPLGKYILRQACEFLTQLASQGFDQLRMSVNISLLQLLQDDFVADLLAIIEETGVKTSSLTLEITESLLMDEYGVINEKLRELEQHGIQIAIDDFGIGYSSLSRSQNLRVHGIKIDKSFIDSLLSVAPEQAIAGDIIAMAHRQGFFVVAEGVEAPAQREYLRLNDCDFMQGYLISKPLAPDAILGLLQHEKLRY